MSLEALDAITLAEEKARQIRAAAASDAKRAEQEAADATELLYAAAKAKAVEELKELDRRAVEKAKEDAAALASSTRNREAAMKAHADTVMEDVVGHIIERIVTG